MGCGSIEDLGGYGELGMSRISVTNSSEDLDTSKETLDPHLNTSDDFAATFKSRSSEALNDPKGIGFIITPPKLPKKPMSMSVKKPQKKVGVGVWFGVDVGGCVSGLE